MLDRYAQQILNAIERDGFYVRVPAGKQFYLYVTQTVDEEDAKIGGTQTRRVACGRNRANINNRRLCLRQTNDTSRDLAPSILQPTSTR